MAKKTQSFQAEIQQLLHMMVHSLYSQKEIFLRELVSNASDALDKLQFESLTNDSIDTADLHVRLEADEKTRTLKIIDNGIGMDLDEVTSNIGTIARSGTKEFLKNASPEELKNHPELIGQFGVGFYSSFMAADKVTLHTQKEGADNGVLWESDGSGEYSIDEVPRPTGRGTTITLHLKTFEEEDQDFTQQWTLQGLVKKYSDFIAWPIKMKTMSQTPKMDDEGKPIEGEYDTTVEDKVLNSQKALWTKSPNEVKKEELNEFYRHLTHDWTDPQKTIHFRAEGTMEFIALMYLPSQRPFDYQFQDREWGLNLYVKRVFIMDKCEDVLPSYLRFVRGLVDSSDLSLNVSREILQQDRQVMAIKKSLTTKVLNELGDMLKKDREGYETFWQNFGVTLKEGVPSDTGNREKIADLALFRSTAAEQWTTLAEYVERMKDGQKKIFYITGESLDVIKASPYLERLSDKGYEVVLMTDAIDEWFVTHLSQYKDLSLQSITAEDLDVDTEEEKKAKEEKRKELVEKYSTLVDQLKDTLKEEVKDVRISDRLKDSAVCLVSGTNDPSANMERIMGQLGKSEMKTKRILEINPEHPLFSKWGQAPSDTQKTWSQVLYGQALLAEGSSLPDPVMFSKQISDLMQQAADKYQS